MTDLRYFYVYGEKNNVEFKDKGIWNEETNRWKFSYNLKSEILGDNYISDNGEEEESDDNDEVLPKSIIIYDNTIRVIGTESDVWMCGKDLCELLGYKHCSYRNVINNLVPETNKKILSDLLTLFPTKNSYSHQERELTYINGLDILTLLIKCEFRKAKEMTRPFYEYLMQSRRKTYSNMTLVDFAGKLTDLLKNNRR